MLSTGMWRIQTNQIITAKPFDILFAECDSLYFWNINYAFARTSLLDFLLFVQKVTTGLGFYFNLVKTGKINKLNCSKSLDQSLKI